MFKKSAFSKGCGGVLPSNNSYAAKMHFVGKIRKKFQTTIIVFPLMRQVQFKKISSLSQLLLKINGFKVTKHYIGNMKHHSDLKLKTFIYVFTCFNRYKQYKER